MFYLRARYYDPSTAQFISRDPAVATTRQPYAYVGDNPLNGTDPSGLWYFDFNVTVATSFGLGFTGGIQIGNLGVRPYYGPAIATPGPSGSVTFSGQDQSEGYQCGVQVAAGGVAGQVGTDGQNGFGELGVGTPGGSVSCYKVEHSFSDLLKDVLPVRDAGERDPNSNPYAGQPDGPDPRRSGCDPRVRNL